MDDNSRPFYLHKLIEIDKIHLMKLTGEFQLEFKSRKQALLDSDKYYFTGKPCPHGHISLRRVSKKDCLECRKMYMQSCKHNGKKLEWDRNYIRNNPEKRKEKRYLQKKIRSRKLDHTEWDIFVMAECLELRTIRKQETKID